jgi:hypothetical protein
MNVPFILIARNVANTDELKSQLTKLAERAIYPKGKAWTTNQLLRWYINEGDAELISAIDKSSPDWLKKAYERGEELYEVHLNQAEEQKITHLIDYLNTQDKDWNRVSVPDMFNQVKNWDEELKHQKKTETNKANFKHILSSGPYQWVEVLNAKGLKDEGSKMGHCVGGAWYARRVASGTTKIYSLRDKDFDDPHVTVEFEVDSSGLTVIQMQGRQNTRPLKYRKNIADLLTSTPTLKPLSVDNLLTYGLLQQDNKIFPIEDAPKVTNLDKLGLRDMQGGSKDIWDLSAFEDIDLSDKEFITKKLTLVVDYLNSALVYTPKLVAPKVIINNIPNLTTDIVSLILDRVTSDNIVLSIFLCKNTKELPVDLSKFHIQFTGNPKYLSVPNNFKAKSIIGNSPSLKARLVELGLMSPPKNMTRLPYDADKIKNPLFKKIVRLGSDNPKPALTEIKKIAHIGGFSTQVHPYRWILVLVNEAYPQSYPDTVSELHETWEFLKFLATLFPLETVASRAIIALSIGNARTYMTRFSGKEEEDILKLNTAFKKFFKENKGQK